VEASAMKFEFSAGAIVFRRQDSKIEYLLLEFPSIGGKERYWGFPKGLIEGRESAREAALREVKEEAGISEVGILEDFKEREEYMFKREGELIRKTASFFLAEVPAEAEVKISEEHTDFAWLSLDDALERLSFESAKKILQKADEFLQEGPAQPRLL